MPTYDYKCKSCENVQEEIHSLKDSPEIKCNKCGSVCEKTFSPSGNFVLKGSDFPSYNARMKQEMTAKNAKMKVRTDERLRAGEGRTSAR